MEQPTPTIPDRDISKQTLIMLVALSCIISVIGVVAMVYELTSTHPAQVTYVNGGQTTAQVGFTIAAPQKAEKPASGTGFVTFKIGE
jgi:hypothetical protein